MPSSRGDAYIRAHSVIEATLIEGAGVDATDQVTGDGTNTYAWDANGNPSGGGNTVATGNRLTSDGTWTYTQDDAGNVTLKGKTGEYWAYGYDTNNRLTHIEKRTTAGGASILTIDFKYDIFGSRIERDYDADGAGAGAAVALKMSYENGNAFLDMDSGLTVSTRRVYSGGLDSLVARINSGSAEDWYLTDNIGSVRDLVNGSGTLIDHIDYTTFGNSPTETNSGNGDRYKFTGREWEAEAQIQYNRARYLQNGRWMSEDPTRFGAGDSNLYRYVSNTPVLFADPTGTQEEFRVVARRIRSGLSIGGKIKDLDNEVGGTPYSDVATAIRNMINERSFARFRNIKFANPFTEIGLQTAYSKEQTNPFYFGNEMVPAKMFQMTGRFMFYEWDVTGDPGKIGVQQRERMTVIRGGARPQNVTEPIELAVAGTSSIVKVVKLANPINGATYRIIFGDFISTFGQTGRLTEAQVKIASERLDPTMTMAPVPVTLGVTDLSVTLQMPNGNIVKDSLLAPHPYVIQIPDDTVADTSLRKYWNDTGSQSGLIP